MWLLVERCMTHRVVLLWYHKLNSKANVSMTDKLRMQFTFQKLNQDSNDGRRVSSLYLGVVWVVFCRFTSFLWSVHEGKKEQGHIIRAPIGRVWGHCWPVAVLHQALSQFKVDASLQFNWNTDNGWSSTWINAVRACALQAAGISWDQLQ